MFKPTSEQLKIFDHDPSQHACILAGPGTGKSSTIIQYLSRVKKKHPKKNIKLLTFTRATNSELIDKIEDVGQKDIISSTLHSFAITLLLKNPGVSDIPQPLRITDEWEWEKLIKRDIANSMPTGVDNVENLKNEMSAKWQSLKSEPTEEVDEKTRLRFQSTWDQHRTVYGYTLLEELPYRLKLAFEGEPDFNIGDIDLLAVDEYQDLNACDISCLRHIADRGVALIAIGDNDQSIYNFRKAHPKGILSFSKNYKAQSYPLSVSLRCGSKMIDWANSVIQRDTSRQDKPNLKPLNQKRVEKVGRLVFNRENHEATGVIRIINYLLKKGIPAEEILIIGRTPDVLREVKKKFDEIKLEWLDPDVWLNLLKEKDTRLLLSHLRLLVEPHDSLSWRTILFYTDKVGDKTNSILSNLALSRRIRYGEIVAEKVFMNANPNVYQNKINDAVDIVKNKLSAIDLPSTTKWGTWIKQQITNKKLPQINQQFLELLEKIDQLEDDNSEASLGQYLSQVEPLIKDIANKKTKGKIRIMPIRRSKGLTVRATIIVGTEMDIIPLRSAKNFLEEIRLLYVGMTRATEYLYVTRTRVRVGASSYTGQQNTARRTSCPFLVNGTIKEMDGDSTLKKYLNI